MEYIRTIKKNFALFLFVVITCFITSPAFALAFISDTPEWVQRYNSSNKDTGRSIGVDGQGVYVAGVSPYESIYDHVTTLQKRSPTNGALEWTKTLNNFTPPYGNLAVSPSGSVFLIGNAYYPGGASPLGVDSKFVVREFRPDGSAGCSKTIDLQPGGASAPVQSVTYDATGIYVGGSISVAGGGRWFVQKISYSCTPLWTTYGDISDPVANKGDFLASISVRDGYLYAAGNIGNNIWGSGWKEHIEKYRTTDGARVYSWSSSLCSGAGALCRFMLYTRALDDSILVIDEKATVSSYLQKRSKDTFALLRQLTFPTGQYTTPMVISSSGDLYTAQVPLSHDKFYIQKRDRNNLSVIDSVAVNLSDSISGEVNGMAYYDNALYTVVTERYGNLLPPFMIPEYTRLYIEKRSVVPPQPTISFSATPNPVPYNAPTTLSWSATNADTCSAVAGSGFNTGGATSGTDRSANLSSSQTFSISCTGAGGSAVESLLITVSQPQCGDGVDNDGDTRVDYPSDPGCSSFIDTDESDDPQCFNRVDDDGDGAVDYPADSGCVSDKDNSESPNPQCSNGRDDDGDGYVDNMDPGCYGVPTNPSTYDPRDPDETTPACFNGVDDDGDAYIDKNDPGCLTDPNDPSTYVPTITSEDNCGNNVCEPKTQETFISCPIDCDVKFREF